MMYRHNVDIEKCINNTSIVGHKSTLLLPLKKIKGETD